MTGRGSFASKPVLAVAELIHRLAGGGTTVEAVARACLERIEVGDRAVRAWVHVDPEAVVARARELDRVGVGARGVLHGVPLGVKDIFDTHDMPTAYGSPIYVGHRPRADAASVSIARRCGMLPLGKLATTEFAAWPPGPTANPHDADAHPGWIVVGFGGGRCGGDGARRVRDADDGLDHPAGCVLRCRRLQAELRDASVRRCEGDLGVVRHGGCDGAYRCRRGCCCRCAVGSGARACRRSLPLLD